MRYDKHTAFAAETFGDSLCTNNPSIRLNIGPNNGCPRLGERICARGIGMRRNDYFFTVFLVSMLGFDLQTRRRTAHSESMLDIRKPAKLLFELG